MTGKRGSRPGPHSLSSPSSSPGPAVAQNTPLEDDPLSGLYPERAVSGFSRADGTVAFYQHVNALLGALGDDTVVVDLGAGRGAFVDDPVPYRRSLRMLRGKAQRVVGVDVDQAVLKNKAVDEAVVIEDGQRLPFAEGSVDVVVSDFTFEHIRNPSWLGAELHRVLRTGGWICARTPNRWGYIGIGARLVPNRLHLPFLRRLQPERRQEDVFPTAYRLNTPEALEAAFPRTAFDHHSFACDSEPTYTGKSIGTAKVMIFLARLTPERYRSVWFIFLRKR